MRFAWVEAGGRGVRPAAQWLSFASPKESPQRKGAPTGCVPALRCGQPAVLASSGVSLELAALRQSRALIRWPLRSSAQPEGNPSKHPFGPSLRSAQPVQRVALAPARWGRATRWPVGCLDVFSPPHLAAPAAGRLRGEHARRSAHASSTDSPWLSERSAPARSEFHGAPRNRTDAGLPRRGRRLWVAFSLLTFFWRSKRK